MSPQHDPATWALNLHSRDSWGPIPTCTQLMEPREVGNGHSLPPSTLGKVVGTQWETEDTQPSLGMVPNWGSREKGCPSKRPQGLEEQVPGTSHSPAWASIESCPWLAGAQQRCSMAAMGHVSAGAWLQEKPELDTYFNKMWMLHRNTASEHRSTA